MPRLTMRNINAAIAKHHVELVKGDGYFYFADKDDSPVYNAEVVSSVYSCHLDCMTLQGWAAHVEDCVRDHYGDEVPYDF